MSKKRILAEALLNTFGGECLQERFWKKLKKKFGSNKLERELNARARVARVADAHGQAADYYADRMASVRDKPWMKGKRADDAETDWALKYNQEVVRYTNLKKGGFDRLRQKAMRGKKD